jgi:hypothetical protein
MSFDRLARSLVRLYPRAWRERDEDEIEAAAPIEAIDVGRRH